MAKPAQDDKQKVTINDRDAKELIQSFVYRDDMDLSRVAQFLETDWEDAYNTMNDLLKQAKIEDDK